jgi:hypothetical protein
MSTPSAARRRALLGVGAGLVATCALARPAAAQNGPGPSHPLAADPVPAAVFAYEAIVTLEPATPVGQTPFGKRNRIPITGGVFKGPGIEGKVLPGGMDWQLIRQDGFTVIEADYMMQAADGALIHVYNKGLVGAAPGQGFYARTTPWFEAPDGAHAWLNQAVFVGTLGPPPPGHGEAVKIRVFKVT